MKSRENPFTKRINVVADTPDTRTTESSEWRWHGDCVPGHRHGPGDGWKHLHPDGRWWVHPTQECDADRTVEDWKVSWVNWT